MERASGAQIRGTGCISQVRQAGVLCCQAVAADIWTSALRQRRCGEMRLPAMQKARTAVRDVSCPAAASTPRHSLQHVVSIALESSGTRTRRPCGCRTDLSLSRCRAAQVGLMRAAVMTATVQRLIACLARSSQRRRS